MFHAGNPWNGRRVTRPSACGPFSSTSRAEVRPDSSTCSADSSRRMVTTPTSLAGLPSFGQCAKVCRPPARPSAQPRPTRYHTPEPSNVRLVRHAGINDSARWRRKLDLVGRRGRDVRTNRFLGVVDALPVGIGCQLLLAVRFHLFTLGVCRLVGVLHHE